LEIHMLFQGALLSLICLVDSFGIRVGDLGDARSLSNRESFLVN